MIETKPETSPAPDQSVVTNPLDHLICERLQGREVDISELKFDEVAMFALEEAYKHMLGQAGELPNEEMYEIAGECRMARFVFEAIRLAVDVSEDENASRWCL